VEAPGAREDHSRLHDPDGSYIAAASEDHDVYLMEFGGKLLWANTTGDEVAFVKVSDDGEYVVSYSATALSRSSPSAESSSGPTAWENA